jgi:plasmid stabilization system protein ParE
MNYRLSPSAEEDLDKVWHFVISRVLHGSQDQVAAWRESDGETEQT